VFDLEKHSYVEINVQHLEPYKYDKTLISKLVLSEEKKSLINTLVSGSQENIEDIVAGKMAGVIVLATGEPGIGKTLTAEVFSEEIEKPLYVVQCSQLGLDIETIEGNLSKVLGRAQRWGAILLIDEADVYIHERGNDMEQNAIIGVFLRVLEYYRGILFMTSNRGEIIDDAIMSRATAWIRYERPSPKELKEIWAVLSKQFKVSFENDAVVNKLIALYPRMSGREVRNILKLTRLAHGSAEVNLDELKYLAGFQQLANAVEGVEKT
jgi:AAA+ superfamily predicted ATPase